MSVLLKKLFQPFYMFEFFTIKYWGESGDTTAQSTRMTLKSLGFFSSIRLIKSSDTVLMKWSKLY